MRRCQRRGEPDIFARHVYPEYLMTTSTDVYAKLKNRDLRREGLLIGEGRLVVERMISAGCRLHSVITTPRFADHFAGLLHGREDTALLVRSERAFAEIAGFKFHGGVLACAHRPAARSASELVASLPEDGPVRLLICDGIASDENLGAIVRSVAAFAVTAGVIGPTCCDPFSRRALKVSAGTALPVPIAQATDNTTTANAIRKKHISIAAGILLYAFSQSGRQSAGQ